MAETLLALILVTSSAKGPSLVYRWPPSPESCPRLARPRPAEAIQSTMLADNPWKAANQFDGYASTILTDHAVGDDDDDEYIWPRSAERDRSKSFSCPVSHPSSGRASPSPEIADNSFDGSDTGPRMSDYDELLGYSAEFLASLLCPKRSLCHQKFELIVDNLAFIGHPVCSEKSGIWRFKTEGTKPGSRGRETRKSSASLRQQDEIMPSTPQPDEGHSSSSDSTPSASSWLQTFHFVLVLDLPDPSSSASGNVSKYFDIIYEHIAFTVTAVLFQEQVLSNFVETECDLLGSLRDDYVAKAQPFADYMTHALKASSIAPAMKSLYEAIKSRSIANITIRDLPLELQLPPYLDLLLHNDDYDDDFIGLAGEHEESSAWGKEMGFAWRLPTLAPWKSLLLLDDQDDSGENLYANLMGQHVIPEDRQLAEQLIRFLQNTSVTLSLADMASLLDWDLRTQVYPTVRWLVHHRRAKVVDIVHPQLKTVFVLPSKFQATLVELSAEFARDFPYQAIPTLPTILSKISMSTHKQSDNHFFATVVKSKDLIPLYQDVVIWMLKRDLLVTVHLRVRVVATPELKQRVRMERERAKARRSRTKEGSEVRERSTTQTDEEPTTEDDESPVYFSLSPKTARREARRLSPNDSARSQASEPVNLEDEEEEGSSDPDNEPADDAWPSMIGDPGRATPKERRWLTAMSEGKDPYIVKRFELITQYFDGKCTDDEILFRADVSRKQLREVLHHYDEFLQTFLHPS